MKVSYPGPNVGEAAKDGTLHPVLGEIKPGVYDVGAFWPRDASQDEKEPGLVKQLADAGFFKAEKETAKVDFPAPAPKPEQAVASPAPAATEETTTSRATRGAEKKEQ